MDTTLDSLIPGMHKESPLRDPVYCIYLFTAQISVIYLYFSTIITGINPKFFHNIGLFNSAYMIPVIYTWIEKHEKEKWFFSFFKIILQFAFWRASGNESNEYFQVYLLLTFMEILIVLPANIWRFVIRRITKWFSNGFVKSKRG